MLLRLVGGLVYPPQEATLCLPCQPPLASAFVTDRYRDGTAPEHPFIPLDFDLDYTELYLDLIYTW